MENAYELIRQSVASDLLEKINQSFCRFFEKLVIDSLVAMGYGGSHKDASEVIGKSGDEGIDGIIKEDKLGLDVIYVQAKKWKDAVSRPEIQKFIGALGGQGARKGVFITTSKFTTEAKNYLQKNDTKIILIDGHQLVDLMIGHNIGVHIDRTLELKSIDHDFFLEED